MRPLPFIACLLFATTGLLAQPNSVVRIAGVGDVNLGTSYPSKQYLAPNDNPLALVEPARVLLQGVDVAFCNLEGPFADGINPVKRCRDSTRCYLFRTPTRYFKTLVDVGFNMFSLANNHSLDFGYAGVKSTYQLIDSAKLAGAGTTDRPYAVFERNGVVYGFCAFSPNAGTVNMNSYAEVKKIVQHLDTVANIVIVSFHGGAEGKDRTSVPKQREIYLGEDRGNVYEFAKMVIDAGADVVFGHGPHVPRAVHLYKDRFIAFSLGNFCTHGRFNVLGVNGYAPLLVVSTKPNGEFVEATIHSFIQSYGVGIVADNQNRVAKFMRDLTRKDFPDSPLLITENGMITKK